MQKVPKDAKMTDFFHFQKAKNYDASKWAVFLPGTGGLRIFKDTTHYYNVAEKLNAEGISVLLVDNVAAYNSWKKDLFMNWKDIKITQVDNADNITIDAGNNIDVSCEVELPNIDVENITVEAYYGKILEKLLLMVEELVWVLQD